MHVEVIASQSSVVFLRHSVDWAPYDRHALNQVNRLLAINTTNNRNVYLKISDVSATTVAFFELRTLR